MNKTMIDLSSPETTRKMDKKKLEKTQDIYLSSWIRGLKSETQQRLTTWDIENLKGYIKFIVEEMLSDE